MDVVYYVKPGERNEELRYSLRSLDNLPHDRVWIVGHKPAWVRGVEFIRGNRYRAPMRCAVDNLLLACERLDVEEFVVFNDDFYVMAPVAAIPSWHAGLLAERVRHGSVAYRGHLVAAQQALADLECPLAWTLHIPMVVKRTVLADVLGSLSGSPLPEWRTMYGNRAGLTGELHHDVKVRRRRDPIPPGPFLSSNDATLRVLRPLLMGHFPTPGRYEA